MPIRTTQRIAVPPSPPLVGAAPLNVPQIYQEQTQWCWAACTDMALHYYGNPAFRQCQAANWLFSQTACCVSGDSSLCNQPCPVGSITSVYSAFGLRSYFFDSAVTFESLDYEIAATRPVEVGYAWSGGGGHVALVIETTIVSGNQVVRVNDPWYGPGGVYYTDLLSAYGQGQWRWTWYGIQR